MEFIENSNIKIICICGKAGSGKSTIANHFFDEYTNKKLKVIISPYTKYLKKYASEILDKEVDEDFKPRMFLQKLSSDLIKNKLGYNDFFIIRQLEDINIYKFFFDVIIIPDVRFPKEIECLKDNNYNVISIGVTRDDYDNKLTDIEKKDITEIALDNYNHYDYIIKNVNKKDLKKKVIEIIREVDKNE